jgi:hypothetical protein
MSSAVLEANGWVRGAFPAGLGYCFIGSTASSDFGGGTLSIEILLEDGTWGTVQQYTSVPSPNPVALDFGGASTSIRARLASSTAPDLYVQLSPGTR